MLSAFCVRSQVLATFGIMDDNDGNSTVGTEFAVDREARGEVMRQRLEGFEALNISNMDTTADEAGKACELNPAMARARATALLTNGDGALCWSSGPPLAVAPTLLLVKLVKQATDDLLDRHRAAVHESCGLLIDKQLALGFAIGDALGRELLASEARDVGKTAAGLLTAAKKKDDALKGNAAAKRTRVRKATAADQLDRALAAIDAARDEQRAALWAAPANLPIPTGSLVPIRERPLRPQPPPRTNAKPTAVDELTAARAALATAQAARTQAELNCRQTKRALAKLQPPTFSGKKINHLDMSDDDFAAVCAAEMKVSETEGMLRLAELEVKSAQGNLELELRIAEREREAAAEREARAAERAARQREMQAKAEMAAAERAAAARAVAAAQERQAAFKAWQAGRRWHRLLRHLHLCAAFDQIEAAEARDRTRARLEAHSRAVWGSASGSANKENSEPQVFRLVGKSAEEVRALASQVSQSSTSAEERVALNKLERMGL